MLNQRNTFRVSPIMGLIVFFLFIMFIYMMIKGLYAIAGYIVPVMVIATLIINHKVYLDYGKFLAGLFKNSIVGGIIGAGLTFLLFPFVAIFLLIKAIFLKYLFKNIKDNPVFQERKAEGDYLEYEEVEEEKLPTMELPPVEPKINKKDNNPYDGYFN